MVTVTCFLLLHVLVLFLRTHLANLLTLPWVNTLYLSSLSFERYFKVLHFCLKLKTTPSVFVHAWCLLMVLHVGILFDIKSLLPALTDHLFLWAIPASVVLGLPPWVTLCTQANTELCGPLILYVWAWISRRKQTKVKYIKYFKEKTNKSKVHEVF